MKKQVKQHVQQMEEGAKDRRRLLKEFSRMLDDQVWILSDFLPLADFWQYYFELKFGA